MEWLTLYTSDPKEHYAEYGFVSLTGLNGVLLNVSCNLLELQTEWDWLFFLKDLETTQELRDICMIFSKFLGNPLYLPDSYCFSSYVFDGKTYEEIMQTLSLKFGAPAKRISDLLLQNDLNWDTKGYFIDSLEK